MTDFPSPTENTPQGRNVQKRKRIPIACSACRARKSRCDGQRPKCSNCSGQDIECEYAIGPSSTNAAVPKSYLDHLESRLGSLETEVRQLKLQLADVTSHSNDSIPRLYVDGTSTTAAGSASAFETSITPQGEISAEDRSPDATDGVGTIEFTNEEAWAYFGPSSNIAFTRLVRRALGHVLQTIQGSSPLLESSQQNQGNALAVSRPQSPQRELSVSWTSNRAVDSSRLPPEPEVTRLVRQFFGDTGLLFPYIHERRLWETYRHLQKSGMKSVRNSWIALLNMILAMATCTQTSNGLTMEQRYSRAEIFFNRAKALCLDQMIECPSVETVQVMLLMSQYLQGTQRSIKTWSIHGLAMKAAFQLGLHSTQTSQHFDVLERETRLRTWYGCVVLDRTLSMTFGRPPSIPQSYRYGPLPRHQIGTESPITWSSEPNSTIFWNATITLYSIQASVIQELYGSNIGDSEALPIADVAAAIFRTEQQLVHWQTSMSASMKLVDKRDLFSATGDSLLWKFRVILTLRYHSLRILSHRPVLDRYLQAMVDPELAVREANTLQQIGQLSKTACISSAQVIIGIVSVCTTLCGSDGAIPYLGAWWFTLYYTFNAAITVAAAMLTEYDQARTLDRVLDISTLKRLDMDLEEASLALVRVDYHNTMPEKCVKFIAALRYLLQGIRSNLSRDNITVIHPADGTSEVTQGDSTVCGTLSGEDEMLASMMDYLHSNRHFQDLGSGDILASPEFTDNFGNSHLFW